MLFRTILIISIVFIQGCSSFQQSNLSNNEIFAIGKAYFSKQKFQKAKDKFEIIVHNEQGTNLGLESTFYLAKSLFELEEYDEASYNFNYYSMFSKDIDNVEFAQYMKCRCAFEVTLPYNKDQSNSLYAISIIQEFLDKNCENWRNNIISEDLDNSPNQQWLYDITPKLGKKIMTNINKATVVTPSAVFASAILNANKFSLSREKLIARMIPINVATPFPP